MKFLRNVVHRWFNWRHFVTNRLKLTVKISRLAWESWLQQQKFWFTIRRCLLRIPTRTFARPRLFVVLLCPTAILHDITTNHATANNVFVFFITLVHNYSRIGRFIHWTTYTYLLTYLLTYVFTYLLTKSMEQSPSWETNRFSACQEIPRILWNSKVHHRNHKCPPPVPILSQLDPVHTPTTRFLKIHLNIKLPPTSVSQVVSFRQISPPKPCACLSSPPYAPHVPSISFFSILSPEKYWVRSTD